MAADKTLTAEAIQGDCLEVMATMDANAIDTIITDPPYGLSFMGKDWDHGVPGVPFWTAALRVAKPGAFLLAFGGTRTFHRLTCAIEDAGWEIRDCLLWLYGSGFPKGQNIGKAIDKAKGAERAVVERVRWDGKGTGNAPGGFGSECNSRTTKRDDAPATDLACQWEGWNTGLKPAWEPIVVAMKPLDGTYVQNAERWGVAGLNVDGCRIPAEPWSRPRGNDTAPRMGIAYAQDTWTKERMSAGANEEGPRTGRWPANLVLDEEAAAMLDEQSGQLTSGKPCGVQQVPHHFATEATGFPVTGFADSGGASRFFYCAKASRAEREEGLEDCNPTRRTDGRQSEHESGHLRTSPRRNSHPTVKPLALMEWLCRLTMTPTGGIVLDPFTGSGTTGVACVRVGRPFIGIEKEESYCAIARARIAHAQEQAPLFAEGHK